jgi:hypothetical protein
MKSTRKQTVELGFLDVRRRPTISMISSGMYCNYVFLLYLRHLVDRLLVSDIKSCLPDLLTTQKKRHSWQISLNHTIWRKQFEILFLKENSCLIITYCLVIILKNILFCFFLLFPLIYYCKKCIIVQRAQPGPLVVVVVR